MVRPSMQDEYRKNPFKGVGVETIRKDEDKEAKK